jgi:hypothetical protein
MVIGDEESMVENLEIPSTRPVRLCADLSSVGSSQPGMPIEGANPERGFFFSLPGTGTSGALVNYRDSAAVLLPPMIYASSSSHMNDL